MKYGRICHLAEYVFSVAESGFLRTRMSRDEKNARLDRMEPFCVFVKSVQCVKIHSPRSPIAATISERVSRVECAESDFISLHRHEPCLVMGRQSTDQSVPLSFS